MISESIIKNTAAEDYLIKKTQIIQRKKNSSLKRLSYKVRSIIRIKYRRLSTKSSNIKQ